MRNVFLACLIYFVLLLKLVGESISNEIDFLPSLYVANPDEKAVSPFLIRGPCGRNSLGYLHIQRPMGFMVTEECGPAFDRTHLIPLPEAKPYQADNFIDHPFEPPLVRPEKRPAEILTVATHPEVAQPLSLGPQQLNNEVIKDLFKDVIKEAEVPEAQILNNQKTLPQALEGLNLTIPKSQMLLPESLLYYFQNNGSGTNNQPTAILPFDIPLSGIGGTDNTTNFSSATYIVE